MQEWSCRHIKQLWYRWSNYSVSLTRDPTVDCSWVGLMDQFTVPPPSLCRTVKCYKLVKVAKEWRNASFICNQWHLSSRWPVKSIFELSTWIWSNVSESLMEDTLLHSTFHWNCLSWNKLCVDLMIVWTEQYIQYWHLANECPAPAPTTGCTVGCGVHSLNLINVHHWPILWQRSFNLNPQVISASLHTVPGTRENFPNVQNFYFSTNTFFT